ncbi:helix-turn-helix domain-containing protein [Labrys okinawensis]|uniref:helix-turn-helix domain-containing protein n=1 Tax=Labrys okinawensis TaxID=346911 RepID=UPI0039BC2C44
MAKTETEFGAALIESLKEVAAWKRGEIALPVRKIPSITAEQVKAIRKAVSKSPKDFAKRFGIPARTLEGWEQGRRHPDPAASALLRVIEKNPKAVEEALADPLSVAEPGE